MDFWKQLDSGTRYQLSSGSFTMGAANMTLYAEWSPAYTVSYNANNATSGTVPTDSSTFISGAIVTTASNSGSLARTSYGFSGWNTAADGSGTTYSAGATFVMGASNVTLYAKWNIPCGSTLADNCYSGANAPAAKAAGSAITQQGKLLTWNLHKVVWEEFAGTRVLASDGTDNWALQLNANGRSYGSIFLAKTNVAGQACPGSVFVPGNLVASGF